MTNGQCERIYGGIEVRDAMRDPRSKIEGDSAMVEVRDGDSCSNINNSELSNYYLL